MASHPLSGLQTIILVAYYAQGLTLKFLHLSFENTPTCFL